MSGTRGVAAAAAVTALAAVVATSATAASSPAPRAVQVAKLSLKGDHGQRWDALHPKYRAFVPKSRFVACERKAAAGLANLTVKGVAAEGTAVYHVTVPLLGTVDVNDVTLAVTFRQPGGKSDQIAEVDSLWVAYRGHWVQLYSESDYEAYKAGNCP